MDKLLSNFTIKVPDTIYLKDPESSELGQNIIKNSIGLIQFSNQDIVVRR